MKQYVFVAFRNNKVVIRRSQKKNITTGFVGNFSKNYIVVGKFLICTPLIIFNIQDCFFENRFGFYFCKSIPLSFFNLELNDFSIY